VRRNNIVLLNGKIVPHTLRAWQKVQGTAVLMICLDTDAPAGGGRHRIILTTEPQAAMLLSYLALLPEGVRASVVGWLHSVDGVTTVMAARLTFHTSGVDRRRAVEMMREAHLPVCFDYGAPGAGDGAGDLPAASNQVILDGVLRDLPAPVGRRFASEGQLEGADGRRPVLCSTDAPDEGGLHLVVLDEDAMGIFHDRLGNSLDGVEAEVHGWLYTGAQAGFVVVTTVLPHAVLSVSPEKSDR
jgi:hypothetical protein